MGGRRALIGGLLGLGATAVILVGLRILSIEFARGITRGELEQARSSMVWLTVLGVLVGLTAIGGRLHPLVPGLPAVVLLLVNLPLLASPFPTWYPAWLTQVVLASAGPTPFVIIGVLLVAAGWELVQTRRAPRPLTPTKVG